jgi:hypothetical protein
VREHAYVVCEKSDGVRMLLVTNPDGIFLVDRTRAVTRHSWLPPSTSSTTVLDGELVGDEYMVFDGLVVDDDHVGSLPLVSRLERIAAFIHTTTPLSTLTLVLKKFYSLCDIRQAVGDSRRTDGIVLTPCSAPYGCSNALPIFKWKYLASIDVLCRGDTLCVNDDAGASIPILSTTALSSSCTNGSIVEIYFSPEQGTWHVLRTRSDRTRPNHVRTLVSTLTSMAEHITIDELATTANE